MANRIKKLLRIIKGSAKEKQSTSVDVSVNNDIDTTKHEAQGLGKYGKIIAKKGSTINVNNSINISLSNIPDKKSDPVAYKECIKEFRDAFLRKEIQFVESQANKDISSCHKITDNEQTEAILALLKGVVPEQDLLWIRTGLCVRGLNEDGHKDEAKRIKNNASRNSQRARNIINLVSAGFLEEYIVPICQSDNDFSVEQYEEIVECLPSFIFVNSNMSIEDIVRQVNEKIEQKERYHFEITSISVNGLNSCVDLIREAQANICKKHPGLRVNFTESISKDLRKGKLLIIL